MKIRFYGSVFFLAFCTTLLFSHVSFANELNISNVAAGVRNTGEDTVQVSFDLAWDNSWKNKINHDAVWLTVRLNEVGSSVKNLCQLSSAGLSAAGTSAGTNTSLEVYVPADQVGAFIRRKVNSPTGNVSSEGVVLSVNYASCGFTKDSEIEVNVFGFEMVYVPEGAFYAGDNGVSTAALVQGESDADPWNITTENAINVSAASANGYYYVSAANPGEVATGSSFVISADFPKGYKAFYAMKYEITEGQWVDFINSIPTAARTKHDLTDSSHKNSDSVIARNTLSCSGSPLTCVSARPSRALNFLNWRNVCAFLDWAGLRPMSELEYEKMARGPYLPLNGEYAWGSTDLTAATSLSGTSEEAGDEVVVNDDANANYGPNILTGGDADQGVDHASGPLRAGIFATSISNRISSGAGSFGIMELSGNVKEPVVTIGNAEGLGFTGDHGNGYLSSLAGFEGNADVAGWPGMDAEPLKGVTATTGSGLRGGSWADVSGLLRVSDRSEAALAVTNADALNGGRGVRTDVVQ